MRPRRSLALFEWCENYKMIHGRNPSLRALREARGETVADVREAVKHQPGLKYDKAKRRIQVRVRNMVGVEIRSIATGRVPKGGRIMFRPDQTTNVHAAVDRAQRELMPGRRPGAYRIHPIEEGEQDA